MASTYVNNLRLEEIGTGEQSGTWGDTTNTNLEIIGQAVAWGTRAIANASSDNITIADGALDADRCLGLKLTGGGQACTVSLLPNTSSKTWFMYNATAAALTFTCGSGANVIIPAGQTKVIATDGLGSGGVVHDLLTAVNLAGTTVVDDLTVSDDLTVGDDLAVTGLATIGETLAVTGIATFTDDIIIGDGKTIGSASTVGAITIASDGTAAFSGDVKLAHDLAVLGFGVNNEVTLTHVHNEGLTLNGSSTFNFRNADSKIHSSSDNQLDLIAATEIEMTTPLVEMSGSLTVGDTTTIDLADGTADNEYALIVKNRESTDDRSFGLLVHAGSSTTDRAFTVNDHDGNTALLTVDGIGTTSINGNIKLPDDRALILGGGSDLQIYHDPDVNIIQAATSDQNIRFIVNDGGVSRTCLDLSSANGGRAIFQQSTATTGADFVNSAEDSIIQITASASNKNSIINFGDGADGDVGKIDYDHNTNEMIFSANAGANSYAMMSTKGFFIYDTFENFGSSNYNITLARGRQFTRTGNMADDAQIKVFVGGYTYHGGSIEYVMTDAGGTQNVVGSGVIHYMCRETSPNATITGTNVSTKIVVTSDASGANTADGKFTFMLRATTGDSHVSISNRLGTEVNMALKFNILYQG